MDITAESIEAFDMAIAALRSPERDPDTGLVPCGCGGEARECGLVFGNRVTACQQCGTMAWDPFYQREANKAWNTAMGYKEADE